MDICMKWTGYPRIPHSWFIHTHASVVQGSVTKTKAAMQHATPFAYERITLTMYAPAKADCSARIQQGTSSVHSWIRSLRSRCGVLLRMKGPLTIIASGFPSNLVDPNLAGITITAGSMLLETLCDMLMALKALHCPNLNLNLMVVEQFIKFFTTLATWQRGSGSASK